MPRRPNAPGPPLGRPRRVLGYVRVSGREQASEGTSLDAQRERIIRWCAERDYPAPDIRLEVESAGEEKIERRVELHRLTAEARSGDLVVVALLDRWSRDIVFGVGSIRALVRVGVRWVAIHEQIDASTPHGDEQLGIRMWVAESERRRIRDRTVGRCEELRAQGLWALASVPFGYRRGSRADRRQLHLEPDPEHAPIVAKLFERAARGEGLRTLFAWMRTVPGAPRVPSQVHRILHSRVYLGEMRAGGDWIRGVHAPIVSVELFNAVQTALAARRSAGKQARGEVTAARLLRGIGRCGVCGRRLAVARSGNGTQYYVCAKRRHRRTEGDCTGPYVAADKLDAHVVEAVLARLRGLRAELLRRSHQPAPVPFDGTAARSRIEARLARAVELAVDGDITREALRAQRQRCEDDLAELARREEEAALAARALDPGARLDVAGALRNLNATWAHMTPEERRGAISLLAARVEIDAEGTLRWTWRTPAELIGDQVSKRSG